MKKINIKKYGGYDKLLFEEHPVPTIQNEQVLVKTRAIGVNYADICVRWGIYESAKQLVGLPITPGFEFAGEVVETGPKVKNFKKGDKVFGLTFFGGYSEFVSAPESQIFPIPDETSFEEAAGFPVAFLTAYHALFQNIILKKNMKLLIHSAAGGVGGALVQLGKIKGCHVTGIVGKTQKIDTVKMLGADHIIDKSKEDLWSKAKKISPEGFDVILDANGFSTLKKSYLHLAPTGKLISYGFHSMLPKKGGKLNYFTLLINYLKTPRFSPIHMSSSNKSIITFNLSFLFSRKDLLQEAMSDLISWIKNKKIVFPPTQSFPLNKVDLAHKGLESGETVGKIVLIP
jgi:NADPH:quinone reductase-like Zn-dependent oxidoreductase